jgi:NAD(P)-dependent dehydrogenase (short-subunit alcohol dehydrogenase family)
MDLGLAGKRALVTGASRGIGAAIARALAAEGCSLYLAARSGDLLHELSRDLASAHGIDVVPFVADLSTTPHTVQLAERCRDADILVNNAGAIPGGRLEDIDDATWRQVWDVKVFAYINLCRAFMRLMRQRRAGVIANIIGASGERPKANYICGATANSALMAFTQALGGDSLEHGVRVIGVNPGPVATERLVDLMKSSAADRFGDASRWQELLSPLPQSRAATVEEIAAATVFAVSAASSYTTGTIITVDGGYCNRGSLM